MRREHPLRRGFFLALAVILVMLVSGKADALLAFEQVSRLLGRDIPPNSFALLWTAMIIPGAFLASLPSRLRHREKQGSSGLKGCILSLAGGFLLTMGMSIAGGNLLSGLFQGSASAWGFLAVVWAIAFLTLRLGRRRA